MAVNNEFQEQKGFSAINLKYMRKFAEEYKDIQFVQQVVAQIPWYRETLDGYGEGIRKENFEN